MSAAPTSPGESVSVQWSPDGAWVAVGLQYPDPPRMRQEFTVFETMTWTVAHRINGANLAGSASWGPDSDRLLVEWGPDNTWVHHLDGTRQTVTVLPEAGTRDMRPIRPVGLADNGHLLTLRQRSKRMTVGRTSLTDGTTEEIVAWTGVEHMYPVLAPMPPAVWEHAAREWAPQ